jgi:hypothetical protein
MGMGIAKSRLLCGRESDSGRIKLDGTRLRLVAKRGDVLSALSRD